jgi:hypothetical protein
VYANRHPQVQATGSQLVALGFSERGSHRDRSPGGAQLMVRAWKQQQEGIATEFEQAASLLGRKGEHPGEDVVQNLGQLLRSNATTSRKALRKGSETGDVNETQ